MKNFILTSLVLIMTLLPQVMQAFLSSESGQEQLVEEANARRAMMAIIALKDFTQNPALLDNARTQKDLPEYVSSWQGLDANELIQEVLRELEHSGKSLSDIIAVLQKIRRILGANPLLQPIVQNLLKAAQR